MSLATERTSDLHIDWDVPLPMRDGTSLRADVFRPLEAGRYPVLLSYGPYGKWLSFQDGYPTAWDIMVSQKPEVAEGSSGKYQNWEVADPERWVPYGYVCVRVDSRGAGRSPGVMDCHSPQEIEDLYECIEWAGVQPWSSGKVGLSGISYYAINQWRVAALNPPHLAAIMVWEGYQDRYRDGARHGGILCSFAKNWLEMQVKPVQHGMGTRGKRSSINGDWVSGPETLDDETLSRNRVDAWPELSTRHTDDAYYAARRGDLSRITVPLLSAGNWGGHGLHLRGNVEGFLGAGSQQKWLELHGGAHWVEYYTDYGVALQKRFFDHFLKGEDNGWNHQPRVQLQVRHVDHFVPRSEHEWPLARTQWTRYYLDPNGMRLTTQPPEATSSPITYDALGPGLTFRSEPLESELELTGPSALKIRLSSVTMDADVFAVLRVFEPGGDEVLFYGALDPKAPVAQGWLRASHRKLDPQRSLPYRPYHTHDELMPLEPGRAVDLDVEIWPTSIVIPKDYRLALTLLGRDYEHEGDAARLSNMKNAMRGCGPFIHDAPDDRPAAVFGQSYSLHFDAAEPPHVLVPVIPG